MTILGLPAHILLLHGVVVLAPLAGLAAILFALMPRARRWIGWPLAALALVVAPLAVVTASAGESLQESVPGSALIEQHADQGELLRTTSLVFLVIAVLAVSIQDPRLGRRWGWMERMQGRRSVRVILLVLLAVAGAYLIYQSIITGHSGASSVWGAASAISPPRPPSASLNG